MEWGRFDHIKLGGATREGVEFSWWLVVPRRFFKVKDGKRVYLPESDQSGIAGLPGRLDDLPRAAAYRCRQLTGTKSTATRTAPAARFDLDRGGFAAGPPGHYRRSRRPASAKTCF